MSKAKRIEPKQGLWKKPISYFKEYVSYVEHFNKSFDKWHKHKEKK